MKTLQIITFSLLVLGVVAEPPAEYGPPAQSYGAPAAEYGKEVLFGFL